MRTTYIYFSLDVERGVNSLVINQKIESLLIVTTKNIPTYTLHCAYIQIHTYTYMPSLHNEEGTILIIRAKLIGPFGPDAQKSERKNGKCVKNEPKSRKRDSKRKQKKKEHDRGQ